MRVTEKAVSDLVYEVSALVQQRDAALLTIATLRGNDDVYDLGSDVGESRTATENPFRVFTRRPDFQGEPWHRDFYVESVWSAL